MFKTKDIDVVILCGGLGRRLGKVVNDRPKPMVEINHQLFSDILIKYLYSFGFRNFILSVGYMADKMKRYYTQREPLDIKFSEEKRPLGTGGAVKRTEILIKSNPFLVINGDSFCRIDFRKFLIFHHKNKGLASMVVVKNKQNQECGYVMLNSLKRISNFYEKAPQNNNLVSAGIYLFNKEIFHRLPKKNKFSLEYDLFPKLSGHGLYGYLTPNTLIDIGTPQGLKRAELYFKRFKV